MDLLSRALALVVAAVTLVPAAVSLRPSLAQRLYAVDPTTLDPAVRAIVLHRAVFFALSAGLLTAGAFVAEWRLPALVVALVSKGAFVRLAQGVPTLSRIARIDVALVLLSILSLVLRERG